VLTVVDGKVVYERPMSLGLTTHLDDKVQCETLLGTLDVSVSMRADKTCDVIFIPA
jgi:hypothetical protein